LILIGFIFSFLVFAWFARDLPSPGKLSQSSSYSSIFYDRDGKVLYEMYKDKNRLPVSFNEIPDSLKKATISIEDKNFYKHKGISELGIIRAVLSIIFRGSIQGGSTITQQLIKNVLLNSSRTASRKIKEWILAVEVERRYTKDQILEMYLNEAPYGGNFYGVASAAQGYFGKTPKELSLLESAILAGLPQRPSYYSPLIGTKDAWKARTKDVLRRMREDGYISKAEEQENLKKIDFISFASQKFAIQAPHFVFYVKDELEKIYGSKFFDEGIKVKTTLNAKIQEKVEEIVKKEINSIRKFNATNAAVVVLDSKTNEILAMVGSYDYFDEKFGKFNAALGLRQPGSTVKPITYALAFEKGYTPATLLMDVKTIFPVEGNEDYIPVNYDGKFRGPIQLRFALGNSINIPAVKLLAMVGIRNFLDQANKMGLTTLAPTEKNLNRFGLSITLGGGEVSLMDLSSAFSVFARGGIKKETQSVVDVKDYKNKIIYKQKKGHEEKVLSPEAAFLISHILSDNNARIDVFGSNSYLNIPGKTVAVKTGTTDDKRDNWAVGYTKSVTVGVWVGNNDNSKMNPKLASGATGASSIWYLLMNQILSGKLGRYEDGIMDKPEKVKAVQIDAFLGGLPKEGYPTRAEYFIEGTEPKEISPFYKKLKISKATGKLANDIEIKNGNYEEKEFIMISENDPVSIDGKNRWQDAINEWAKNQSDDKFKPPTELSDASADEIVVSITAPGDKNKLDSNNVSLKAKITTNSHIKNIKLFLNNNEIKNYDENKKEIDETINLADGIYEFKIKATNEKDKSAEATVKFGVNQSVD